MNTVASDAPTRPARFWVSWVLSGLPALFLLMDAGMKLAVLPVVTESSVALGWPATADMARGLGLLLLACTVLYLLPGTSILGMILLTGYFGGTVATHVRVGSPLFTHVLFGVYLALMMWGGLYLREPRLRALLPLRSDSQARRAAEP